jgi:putative addiction module component (TIGR02574 family)
VLAFDPMADPIRRLEPAALKLSPKERARLAEQLISSLDDHADPDSERLWLGEAERRLDELLTGKVAGISADEVFRKARSSLR